ncbi:hypothetical protein N7510_001514 [Penicillium lagena]|uniref:uncharacterized protein n=1 Tax=Penicillium lagena TaxID=94218 RepID=UPI002540FED1|nr:uncharacterized protein N7510_001514 [Penicillium lagena]KAJ5625205.1 hypothetical protein N7510_001514 [Penicillium lagena]
MKVLSLAMAFVFAALAVAGSMEESSSNKLAERESDEFEHSADWDGPLVKQPLEIPNEVYFNALLP